jgi:hypothetical protein
MSLSNTFRRTATVFVATALGVGATVLPANAQDLVLEDACPGFFVGLTFGDSHGNPVQVGPRAVSMAGTTTYTLDNETTGATITVRTAGVLKAQSGPDGSTIFTVAGPSVLILFSSDPRGPSTTLYQGQVVTSTDAAGVTTILSESGPITDLCSALGA